MGDLLGQPEAHSWLWTQLRAFLSIRGCAPTSSSLPSIHRTLTTRGSSLPEVPGGECPPSHSDRAGVDLGKQAELLKILQASPALMR